MNETHSFLWHALRELVLIPKAWGSAEVLSTPDNLLWIILGVAATINHKMVQQNELQLLCVLASKSLMQEYLAICSGEKNSKESL